MKKSEEQLGGERTILGSLDVKDAFLQVKQEAPTQVTTATGHFEVLRNLPGQRIGAKAWFDHLTEWLKSKGLQFCPENPCLGRAPLMCLLIHVDDIMFVGSMDYVMTEFIPEMKKAFDISEHHLKEDGSSFQFLRRTYEKVENGLRVHPGKYAESMVEAYGGKLGKTKFQKLPRGAEILEPDGTRYDLASLYRSLVGCGICLSQERLDVSYTVKELAATMSCPTSASLKKLGKLIGCLKHRMGQHSLLELQEPGHGLVHQSFGARWILETFRRKGTSTFDKLSNSYGQWSGGGNILTGAKVSKFEFGGGRTECTCEQCS